MAQEVIVLAGVGCCFCSIMGVIAAVSHYEVVFKAPFFQESGRIVEIETARCCSRGLELGTVN